MKKHDQRRASLAQIQSVRSIFTRMRRKVYLARKRGGNAAAKLAGHALSRKKEQVDLKKLQVPDILSLEKNLEDTLNFLTYASSSNKRSRKQRRKRKTSPSSYFDFVGVKEVCPSTALVLCSVYDVYQRRGGDFRVFDYDDWKPEVKDVFARVGFFKWLDFKGIPSEYEYPSELPIQAFESETIHVAEKPIRYLRHLVRAFNSSRELAQERTIDETTSRRVASSVLEAVENSVRHAYHQGFPKDTRRWWVGGVSLPDTGEVMVACYDCGVSIPGSIEASDLGDEKGVRRHVKAVLQRYVRFANLAEEHFELDHQRLKLALRYLATTSGVEGGGKGLAHIASTIDDCEDGSVEIFTRRAHFYAKKGRRGRYALLPAEMPGTLIIWRMTLYGA